VEVIIVLLLIHGEKVDHMLKEDAVEKLVQKEVKRQVENQVAQAVSDTEWILDLETQIIKFVQDRIVARFSNISTVPDLVATVESSVGKMFEDGFVPNIEHMVDNTLLVQAVDQAIEKLVTKTVDQLVFDPNWMQKIHTQIARETGDRIRLGLQEVNVYDTLRDVVIDNTSLIHEDLDRELLIQDGIVVVQQHLSAGTLDTDSDVNVGGALIIEGDLAVKGRISLSNPSFKELSDTIEKNAIDKLKTEFIDETSTTIREQIQDGLNVKNILVRGESLVDDNKLSSAITKTSIEEIGTLKSLTVGTELKVDNKRVGINTTAPRSALSVWDSEIEIDIGRRSQNTAQIGTSKAHDLSFITNNQEQLTIDKDGLVSVGKLRVGRNRISTHSGTPGWSGAKGDVVFNYNFKPGEAFAWICLGDYRWQELKSA
jgi:molybdopterin-binding protein